MTRHGIPAPTVIKVGGGLSAEPGALDAVGAALALAGRRHRLLVVPGGGPFADAVRDFARREPLSQDAAHWMAILAMDQYAQVLAERIPGAALVDEPEAIGAAGGVAVLAPFRWLRRTDPLPHRWDVTSDSIAAVVAGALGAARLVLVKPAGAGAAPAAEVVDPHFESALPTDLDWTVLDWGRIGELGRLLDGEP